MIYSIARVSMLFAFVILFIAGIAFGQSVTGSILGRVTDTSGAVVSGATVQLQNVDTGFSRTEQTDSEGRYLARNLSLGTYSVTVQQPGFHTEVHSGIVLTVASEAVVNVELTVGSVQESVNVTAEAMAVETTNATLSSLVSQDQLRDLPLNGRSVDTLALLSPGVFANRSASANATVGLGLHLSVNGARQDWNLYLLDGTVMNDALSGRDSGAGVAMGVEGILEFRLLTHGFSAEYGRAAGGIVSAVTRSGTNEFHGSAYEFVRNNIFDARNFFNPGNLPAFRRNQFGATAGGRIIKDRFFFFANYEGLRTRQGITLISSVPDLNARKGLVPNAAGVLTQVPLNPIVIPYLNLYPLPNGNNHGDGTADSIANFSQPTTEDYSMERIDFRLSDKDSSYGRYVYDPSSTEIASVVPTFVTSITGVDRFLILSETHIFSGSSLNEFRFAINRTFPTQQSASTVPVTPSLSFVPGQIFGLISFSGAVAGSTALSSLGGRGHSIYAQNLFQESDTYTIARGAHSLKIGADLEREQIYALNGSATNGNFQFSGLTSLLAGTPTTYTQSVTIPPSSALRGWRRILFGSFIQDDIRLRPNLTVNLGLRYEFFTNPSEVNGKMSALINVTDASNTPGPPFISPKLNFAPRAGLAWDPTGSGKTSVRLGAGIYYNQLSGRSWFLSATTNSDFLTTYQVANPPFPNALAGNVTTPLQQNTQVQYHSKEPTVYQWNLEVQRQLTPTLSLRVGYVGSHGVHLPAQAEMDTKLPIFNPDGTVASFTATATNPRFASLATILTNALTEYNGLQAALQKTVSAGLTFQASYTYSKAMSNADSITTGQTSSGPPNYMNPYNPFQDYSLSAFDQRNTLVVNGAYQMPWHRRLNGKVAKAALGGWAVNGIYSYGSGLPFDILSGFNNSRDGDTTNPDRPNLTPGFSNNPIHGVTAGCQGIPAGQPLHTPFRWFDPCAFTLNAAGTFGNLGRNTVTGPGLSTLDFTLVKMTTLTEKTKLEFRAECFNLANHANFGLPSNSVFSSSRAYAGNAGAITTTSVHNRELQFGLKLLF
jgi:carboxypeptidase family protein